MNDYLPEQKCLSKNTIKSHRLCLKMFVNYLSGEKGIKKSKITFSVIEKQMIVGFLKWLQDVHGCSQASRNQRLSVLRSFFGYAGELDVAQVALEQEIRRIPIPRQRRNVVEYLSENALKAVLRQPDINRKNGRRDRFFMSLMYDTGARVSELLDLKICNLKMDTAHPVAYLRGKGDKMRCVPVAMERTAELYKAYMREFHPDAEPTSKELLFYTNLKDMRHRMSATTVGMFMKKYGDSAREKCKEVPERVHPHQLRHTRAIHLYRSGVPLNLVGEQLGHADPITTKIYAYADAEMKRKAIEKANQHHGDLISEVPVWEDDDDMIMSFAGLK
jgi:site-specific recombinase XerD